MKNFFLLFILLSFCFRISYSQPRHDSVFHLKEFPKEGLLLNSGWTFYPGDDTNCSKYDYDGKNGIAVNPALSLDQLPDVKRSGIGWFRLKLQVDSSLRNKNVGITLSLLGAAEIYLDGERIYQFGKVSINYSEEKTQAIYGTALNFKLGNDENQLLAVRYSHNPNNLYLKIGVTPNCLWIIMYPSNENIDFYTSSVKQTYRFAGIILTIDLTAAFLTLFFFFSFPLRKEYLYYGLYFAFQFLGMLVQSNFIRAGEPFKLTVNELMLMQFLASLLVMTGSIFYLNGMYVLLKMKRTKFYWFLLWYGIISMIIIPFLPPWGGAFPFLFIPLTACEMLPVYYKAARKGFRGAWILFLSMFISSLSLAVMIGAVIENNIITIAQLIAIAVFTPALGLVIFLAGDFARISLSLQSRIVEVEELSSKAITQEKEKQRILASQKEILENQVTERTAELKHSLENLKSTQAQLIQSEKMASLGELTAGIAHEIQNPLNFVNNFSEVNGELISELVDEVDKGNLDEVKLIANDIKENEQKINHHGKRADAIVKGMLQHSRTSTGVKEPTDINKLTDEYLRLAYHGLRGKDKEFNAEIKTDFDENIGKINIVQQDIGRVLLNLFNNAFYALNEKSKNPMGFENAQDLLYVPIVSVVTKRLNDKVEIKIADNGPGIPPNIVDKIFQPFFTTKPTGEGTGLGLSLAYDIIKAHGGEIKVETKEGEGSEFIILING